MTEAEALGPEALKDDNARHEDACEARVVDVMAELVELVSM